MLFCSQKFLLFFAIIFVLYWALPGRRPRVWLLLAASFYFYASWSKQLALIICASTLLDYLVALGMEHTTVNWRRRLLLSLSLMANLGLLGYFKYANFFLQSLTQALHRAGCTAGFGSLEILLPIGISFYTFEAINYTIDVYRRRIRAERNLGDFMLFILFFPHLVAGPIVRARDFLPQIKRVKHWDWARLFLGTGYVVMGVVKKMAIADRMAEYADPIFNNPSAYRGEAILIAMIAYAVQIFCDFSGYTDMAIGTAHMLGYKLARNFNMPYLAVNVAEFWRRWHISLSTWLRDYLFIPLGGSRGSRWQTARNLMITMTLGGLWHGASWTFVFWGVLHGVLLIGHRIFRSFSERRPLLDRSLTKRAGHRPPDAADVRLCRRRLGVLPLDHVRGRADVAASADRVESGTGNAAAARRPGEHADLHVGVSWRGLLGAVEKSLAAAGSPSGIRLRGGAHPGAGAGAGRRQGVHLLPVLILVPPSLSDWRRFAAA